MLEAVRASMKGALNGISYAAKAAANSLESTTEEVALRVPTTVPSTGTIQITTHQRPTSTDLLSNHVNSFSPLVPKTAVHLAAYVILQNHVQRGDPLASLDVFNAAKALMPPGLRMSPSQTSSRRSKPHSEVVIISDDSDQELEKKPAVTPRKTIARRRAVGGSNQASGLPTNAGISLQLLPKARAMDLSAVKQHLEAVHKADLDKGALPFCKDYLCRRKPRTTTTTGFIRHNLLTSAHKDASPGHTFIFVIQAPGVQISSESSSSSEAPLMGITGPSSAPSSQQSLPSTPSLSSKRKGKHPSGASSASKKPKKGTDKKDKGKNKGDQ
ncbi:hypothetical protein QFC21_003981 [Naganishia friedmannii]|uniref:Uncharacterized protein n=1 Tax=Naganishia friedmannii TaxID=89922 RepID=A0ACC2VLD1_9TREE|nr:hypothetical protein QFC21_003981 [Naganishia friedmannii]